MTDRNFRIYASENGDAGNTECRFCGAPLTDGQAAPDAVIEDYLSHLPEASTRDACVYQTVEGCCLPCEMSQDICNARYCNNLRWLRQAWRDAGQGRAVMIVADEAMPRHIAAIDPDTGYRSVARLDGEE